MQLNTRKTNNLIKKWAKDLNTLFSKEDMHMVINTRKDAQHHSLLEKCKWGIISCRSEGPSSTKKKSTKNKCWRGCGEREPSYTVAAAKLCQSCLTLCDPIDGSPPGSSFHGIFQARVLEWVTSAFSTFTVGGNANWYSHYGEQCEDSLKN